VAVEAPRVASELRVSTALLASLPDTLRAGQAAFEATGGLHATGLFAADGELLCLREDVGRHNAMDKAIGAGPTRQGGCRWPTASSASAGGSPSS